MICLPLGHGNHDEGCQSYLCLDDEDEMASEMRGKLAHVKLYDAIIICFRLSLWSITLQRTVHDVFTFQPTNRNEQAQLMAYVHVSKSVRLSTWWAVIVSTMMVTGKQAWLAHVFQVMYTYNMENVYNVYNVENGDRAVPMYSIFTFYCIYSAFYKVGNSFHWLTSTQPGILCQ